MWLRKHFELWGMAAPCESLTCKPEHFEWFFFILAAMNGKDKEYPALKTLETYLTN